MYFGRRVTEVERPEEILSFVIFVTKFTRMVRRSTLMFYLMRTSSNGFVNFFACSNGQSKDNSKLP